MADNVPISAGTGTDIATDDVSAVHFQRVKLVDGALGGSDAIGGDAANGLDVDVTRSALPSGAATSAKQDSQTTLLAGGLPAALGAGGGVKVDGSGTALPVSIASVPSHAVTNAGTFPVQVDGAALTALQLIDDVVKAEDAAHTTADVGVMALAVRTDSPVARSGTDGDYEPLQVANGRLWTNPRDVLRISVQSGGLTTSVTAYSAGDQMGTQFTLANAARASGGSGTITSVVVISAATIIGPMDVVFTRASITLAADNAAYAISDADALEIVALVPMAGAYPFANNRIAQAFNLAIPYDCSGSTSLFANLITRSGHTFFGAATDLQLVVFVERN